MYNGFFDKFHIGTYFLSPACRDEEHVHDLAECGIDLLIGINNDTALLDLLEKYEVGAVVNGVLPGWFGGNGTNAGTMHLANPLEEYQRRSRLFKDHPAIVGIDVGDEPSSLDFPHYGRVIAQMREQFPDKLLYLNLYPSYGMLADAGKAQAQKELGTRDYAEYLSSYAENVALPYVSIDHYPFSSDWDSFLNDLRDASELAKKHQKHLMVVLEVNSKSPDVFISADGLRRQAWCALAYGAKVISWACYSPGWWNNNVLDKNGNKTEQYEKLKTVNRELCAFADEYMRYSRVRTDIVLKGDSFTCALSNAISANGDLLIGSFVDGDGKFALLCVPLEEDADVTISFELETDKAVLCRTPSGRIRLMGENNAVAARNLPIFIYSE